MLEKLNNIYQKALSEIEGSDTMENLQSSV